MVLPTQLNFRLENSGNDTLLPLMRKLIKDFEGREMKRYRNVPEFHRRVTKVQKEPKHPKMVLPTQLNFRLENSGNDTLLPLMRKLIKDFEGREMKRYSNVPEFHRRVTKMLEYSLDNSTHFFPVTTRQAYELIEDPSKVTPEKLYIADVMGCCLRISLLMLTNMDDIVDGHEIRFGHPTWRTLSTPVISLNDSWVSFFLHAKFAAAYLNGTPFYSRAVEIMNDFCVETLIGQYFDLSTYQVTDLDSYTEDHIKLLGSYKMSPTMIIKPAALAVLLTGVDPTDELMGKEVGARIGYLYEVQNDYLDCYGTDDYGKLGTNIEDGKATWLIVKALQLANEQQREVLKQNYGKKDPAAVQRVKQVYDEVNIHGAYLEFAEKCYRDIINRCSQLPTVGIIYKEFIDKLFVYNCH